LKEEAQKQGWAKATKLGGRAMSSGLIGVQVDGDLAAMVEVI
jgi:elongation factor Ts